ncbi:AraC family transcriptional regulator [Cohnella fermenti]|nr:AraC family transcriptional regulator [Cohnella fermenti]
MKPNITNRIMLIYGGVLLVIITLTVLLSYLGTVRGLRDQLKETNYALLNQIIEKMDRSFAQIEKDLLQLTSELEFVYFMNDSYEGTAQKYANFYALNNKMSKFMSRNLQFSSIYVYSSVSGNILTQDSYIDIDQSNNQWIADYLDMNGYFKWLPTHSITNGYAKENVVTLIRSYPAISKPGFRTGLLAVNMKESELYQMIRDIYSEGYKGQTLVIDSEGNVVTHDDKSKLTSRLADKPYVQQVLAGPAEGSFEMTIEGDKQTVFYATSAYTGWKVVSIIPESQVYRPLTVMRNLLIGFASAMLAIGFVVLFIVSRRTIRPFDRLIGRLSGKYHAIPKPAGGGASYLEHVFDELFHDREVLERQVRESKPMIKWRIVMDMLTGHRAEYSAVHHQLEFAGVKLHPERIVVCAAEIGKEGGIASKDETLYTYALCNVAEEIVNAEYAGAAIDAGGGHAALLFSFPDGDSAQNLMRVTTLLEQIQDVMQRQVGVSVTVGVGSCCTELKKLPESYGEAQFALRYKMVTGPNTLILIDDLKPPSDQDYYRFMRSIDRICDELKQAEREQLKAMVDELYSEAVGVGLLPELIRQFSFELLMRLMQAVESLGIATEPIRVRNSNLYERIQQCDNWRQAEDLVQSFLGELIDELEAKRSQRGRNDTIELIREYIGECYGDSGLSLDRLAERFNLNPAYISRLFKIHAQTNFIDYLIETRINAAKQLLKDRSVRVNEISHKVGYTNSRSFMRSFKNYTGLTPTEYRERFPDS